ncbi:MAG: tRNA lysidine(34) synthetase TilS [Bacteroidota bacterium]
MLSQFEKHIRLKKLFSKNDHLLVAISGGVDSVILTRLLCALNYKVSLAHCNFNLRGNDSDADEAFCIALANELKVKIHVQHFNTKSYAKQNQLSIQMAARELRYSWFDELMQKHAYDYLLTAHHANDSVESILLNLIRGSGLNGLIGMEEKRNQLIRPLLPFQKLEIENFAKAEKIKFRKDGSNDEDKYKRNFVRLKLLPLIKQLNPSFDEVLLKNAALLANEKALANAFVEQKKKELLHVKETGFEIIVKQLLAESEYKTIIGAILHSFGFNSTHINALVRHLEQKGLSGKLFKSKSHQLYMSFDKIVISNLSNQNFQEMVFQNLEDLKASGIFEMIKTNKIKKIDCNTLMLDTAQLTFPLYLRGKKTGDKFKPFGMQGFKLLSDYFKEQKLNALQRQNTKLLVNAMGQIMWIVGYRSDERFRVSENSKSILLIKYLGN